MAVMSNRTMVEVPKNIDSIDIMEAQEPFSYAYVVHCVDIGRRVFAPKFSRVRVRRVNARKVVLFESHVGFYGQTTIDRSDWDDTAAKALARWQRRLVTEIEAHERWIAEKRQLLANAPEPVWRPGE